MTRLKKAHVETLLREYDTDPIRALTTALRVALDRPGADWPALLAAAPLPASRRDRLQASEQAALDELAAELNEARGLLAS
ncbi:MAG: hypothetical protein K8R99_13235 [Actinomycetia bacterium]|nr:hypothetical protein [Actinomycetes bacterium]